MPPKLDRNGWAKAVKQHRQSAQPRQSFSDQVKEKKSAPQKSLSGIEWTKRVEEARLSTKSGGRHRALVQPAKSKRVRHKTGGMLKSNSRSGQKSLSEEERKAMVKTGAQVPKRGINASNWAYDHRKATAARRNKTTIALKSTEKKGINAEKWHYDHQKATAAAKKSAASKGKPTTHLSAEKRKTQTEAIARQRPSQPTRPRQPQTKAPAKPVIRKGK